MNINNSNSNENNRIRKRALILSIILGLIFLSSVLTLVLFSCFSLGNSDVFSAFVNGSEKRTANIYQDGNLIKTVDFSDVTEVSTFTVTSPAGGTNVLEISPEGIRVADADCPDKICVHTGRINTSLLPIVCLPNKLVIQIVSKKDESGDVPDALTW